MTSARIPATVHNAGMGRLRRKNLHLPAGVKLVRGRFYWRPTSATERAARKAQGLPETVPLGADPDQMRKAWVALQKTARPLGMPDAGTVAELLDRFDREVLPATRPNGAPFYKPYSQQQYRRHLRELRAVFGAYRYARSEVDAARPRADGTHYLRTMDVQLWITSAKAQSLANRMHSVLSVVFAWGKRWGMTEYNPASGVLKHQEPPRRRDVQPWEVQALIAGCRWNRGLIVHLVDLTGMREGDVLALNESNIRPEGIVIEQGKRGRRWSCAWSDELRQVIDAARAMRPASRVVPMHPLIFPADKSGKQYTGAGFRSAWRRDLKMVNAALRESAAEEFHGDPPQILDLHFHDLRKKAANDADEQGQDAAALLGTSERVAHRHYLGLRPVKTKPTR